MTAASAVDLAASPARPQARLRTWHVLVLVLVALLVRGPTLGLSMIGVDEAIYALVAREILAGHWPYETLFDHKPAALFYHFAAAMLVLGDDPLATRALGIVMVAIAGVLLYGILVRHAALSAGVAFAMAIGFVVASGGFRTGAETNTEPLVNAYTLAWLWAVLHGWERGRLWPFVLAGLLMGVSFHVNYLTGFLLVGFALGFAGFALLAAPDLRTAAGRYVAAGVAACVGFAIATLLVLLPIAIWSDLGAYFGLQREFILGYTPRPVSLQTLFTIVALFAPLAALVAYYLFGALAHDRSGVAPAAPAAAERRRLWALAVLVASILLGSLIAVSASGRFYSHYFLFALPSLWVLLGTAMRLGDHDGRTVPLATTVLLAAALTIGAPGLVWAARGGKGVLDATLGRAPTGDTARLVAARAAPLLPPGETIYAVCTPPVVYHLLRATPPTRFGAFYQHHFGAAYAAAFGFTVAEEVDRVLDQVPAVVVLGDYRRCDSDGTDAVLETDWQALVEALPARGYTLVERVRDYRVYQHETAAGSAG